MAEVLAESRLIQQMDICQNEVKVGGLMALCLALRINRSLVNLDTDQDPSLEQAGAFKALSTHPQISIST